MLRRAGLGGQSRAGQFTDGFPIAGEMGEPGRTRGVPSEPQVQGARFASPSGFWGMREIGSALARAAFGCSLSAQRRVAGRSDGTSRGGMAGFAIRVRPRRRATHCWGPHMADPAFGFRAPQGEKLRAVGDLKRSQTNRAAALRTPVSLPT